MCWSVEDIMTHHIHFAGGFVYKNIIEYVTYGR